MKTQPSRKPWHEVVQLRDDVRSGELSLAVFAADLYDVVMQKGQRPVVRAARGVLCPHLSHLQSAGNWSRTWSCVWPAKAIRRTGSCRSTTAAARPTPSLRSGIWCTIRTRCRTCRPSRNSKRTSDFKAPKARIAALCFDKIDLEKVSRRQGRAAWSECSDTRGAFWPFNWPGRTVCGSFTPTARTPSERPRRREPLVVELLSKPQKDGLSTLVLLDEVLMYLRVRSKPLRRCAVA